MRSEAQNQILEKLRKSYSVYFDIETAEEKTEAVPDELALTGYFYSRSEKYVLVKSAQLWAADSYEYLYIFTVPELNAELFEACREYAFSDGYKKIQPGKEHMYSYITALFLCDTTTMEGRKALKKCRIYKSFKFSLHGWMEFHAVALDLSEQKVLCNRSGRPTAKFIRKYILNSKK